ncbi:MAG: DUF4350 domain-containing protein [Myxococcota bacterium]
MTALPLLVAALLATAPAADAPRRALPLSAPAAADGDYSLDPEAWNGVGYLLATAAEAKVELEPAQVLDLGRLRPGSVLIWLAPPQDLPVAALLAFVRDGGFVVIADDSGAADGLLAEIGIQRAPAAPSSHGDWYQGADGVPLLTPRREHFLFFNVEQVAANYPSVLHGAGDPILTFADPADALIVERRLGLGAILAIADPSIFLNEMLRRFYGNKQLAANALRLYCDIPSCRARLLGPRTRITGAYRSGVGRLGRLPAFIDEAASLLNAFFAAVDRRLSDRPLNAILIWGGLAFLAIVLAIRLRQRRTKVVEPPLTVAGHSASPVRQEAMGLVLGRGDADFAEPARVLLDEAARLADLPAIASLAASASPLSAASDDVRRGEETVRNALLRIHREADSLLRSSPTLVSAERFLRLLADVGTVSRYVEQRAHANPRSPRGSQRPIATG